MHSLEKRIPWHNKQLSPAIAFPMCVWEQEVIHQFIIFCQSPSASCPLQKPIYEKCRGRWARDETAPVVFIWGIFHWCLLELGILHGIWIALPKFAALNEAVGVLAGPGGRQTRDHIVPLSLLLIAFSAEHGSLTDQLLILFVHREENIQNTCWTIHLR